MSVGTQWDLVHSTHLEDRSDSTIERIEARRRHLNETEAKDSESLGSARGVFNGALLGAAIWTLIFASALAVQSLIFG